MRDDRLIHDHAWAAAAAVVRLFAGCLREEEQVDAFNEVCDLLKDRLATFAERLERERHRLRGSVANHEPNSAGAPVSDTEERP